MDQHNSSDLNRRTLLKSTAAGVVGAGLAGTALLDPPSAEAQDKKALQDTSIVTEMVDFKNGDTTVHGFLARPKTGKHGTVILIPGIFGMTDYMKESTAQVAQAGLAALCVDWWSHRAGGAPKSDDFTVLRAALAESAPDKQIIADALAGLAYLKGQNFVNGKYGITGFCMGGRISLLTAAQSPDIVAASPYYGPLVPSAPGQPDPMEAASKIKAKVQGHYGGKDMNPKPEQVKAFYEKLKETNPHGEYFIYEAAGHAFHDFSRPAYVPEVSAQAWGRTLEFFKKNLK